MFDLEYLIQRCLFNISLDIRRCIVEVFDVFDLGYLFAIRTLFRNIVAHIRAVL